MNTATVILNALNAGKNCAKSIKIGDDFKGAMFEASEIFEIESPEYHVFISGFLSVIKGYDLTLGYNSNTVTGFSLKQAGK